jgi:hypothetical protein
MSENNSALIKLHQNIIFGRGGRDEFLHLMGMGPVFGGRKKVNFILE